MSAIESAEGIVSAGIPIIAGYTVLGAMANMTSMIPAQKPAKKKHSKSRAHSCAKCGKEFSNRTQRINHETWYHGYHNVWG